ncbi:MAG: ribonucleoside-diphosphate reductase, adenosylcobalamin-dependent [Thermonema sp.]|uniref:adenosylcobalamin-dependent ribonucleoside-diphosphate reductase n=1 Tax=Thermonema sp. TaxID=2231181 RepID=UPI0021DCEAC4|nr:adenosylcobalamin-dependent ribonucleoside-diphosphate reductase [Thermonema sp.]GIV39923.1 MAG: ribonucleoside-diphosphate reductase, adenosylcobalamin-dependent [Thermonema sp.]
MNQIELKSTGKQTLDDRPVYTAAEAIEASKKYFGGDELAASVWVNKYALKDSFGRIYELTPDDMHRRMAKEIHRIELKYPNPLSEEEIYQLLKDFRYIVPQGGPMTGIGNPFQIASLSNCFVIGHNGPSDSYGGILKIDEEQIQLMKRRGGVGHDLSHIRPKGSPVMNSALTSTGVVPFMERYSNSTREVAQDGRRGALMLTISIKHPDAEAFIDAKLDGTKVTGANVSVKIDDDFMRAVKEGKPYVQQFPIDSPEPRFKKEIDARKLWKKIIHNAWKSAEPGVLFWDTVLRESVPDCYADLGFRTVSTNPCGEIPLCPYDSCRLLAINLFSYVEKPFTEEAYFNWDKFKEHAQLALRIMDDIVDLELEKIDQIIAKIENDPEDLEIKERELRLWHKIREKCIQGRRTGVGITAEGDMLAALGYRYGSDEAIDFSVQVHKTLALEAYRSSVKLAQERGAFPIYDAAREENNPFIKRLREADPALYEEMRQYGRRNIALLTIAPTGTTSIMTQTTSGIEPVFLVSYKRRRKVNPNDKNVRVDFIDEVGDAWEEYHVFHHKFADWLKIKGYDPEEVAKLPYEELEAIIKQSPYYKSTANDIDWVAKVKMQGAIQKWVDHSISVTVNIPEETSEEMVAKIYMTGWEAGCKGITVYREGSRSGVLVSDKKKKEDAQNTEFKNTNAPKRPKVLEADVIQFKNNDEDWVAVVGLLNGRPYEIFTGRAEDSFSILSQVSKGWVIKNRTEEGRSRYDFQYIDKDGYRVTIEGLSRTFNKEYWNYAKLISGVLRHGMPIEYVVDMVNDLHLNDESLNTWKNGVVRALKRYIPDGTVPADNECPNCGDNALVYEEGCLNCKSCGMSQCS